MSKRILVPTDLRIESLNVLKHALKNSTTPVEVILMYSETLSNSIQDLLFYSPQKIINSSITPEFCDALAIIRNRFENTIENLRIEVFHGNNLNAFKKFTEANEVSEALIPKTYQLRTTGNSFNPIPLIKRSNMPYTEIDWEVKNNVSEKSRLDSLFNN